jgi:hypothetical protein
MSKSFDIQIAINKAIEDWYKKNTDSQIEERVTRYLDENLYQIIEAYCGVSMKWGYAELNTKPLTVCGNPKVIDAIEKAAVQYFEKVELPQMTAKRKKEINRELESTIFYRVERMINGNPELVNKLVDEHFKECLIDLDVNSIKRTLGLINESEHKAG